MNRSELEALISSTMSPPPSPQHSSTIVRAHPAPHSQSYLPVRTFPGQQPHSPVRQHGHTCHTQSEVGAALSTIAEQSTANAEQGITPQPQYARSYSASSQAKTPQTRTLEVHRGSTAGKSIAAEIEEPDFIREEREAWSRRSPKAEALVVIQPQPPSYGRATRASYRNSDVILQPPEFSTRPPPQPRKQSKQTLPLREFGPAIQETNLDARPKTSRGPSSAIEDDFGHCSSADSLDGATTAQQTRRSRFLEGSLNERSAAVASSWHENESMSQDSYDSDATPRVLRDTRGSASVASTESNVQPTTLATSKRSKFFKLKRSNKSSEDDRAVTEQQAVPKRKGLRKSLSTWNFHNLGDKMWMFGGSTNDLTPKAHLSDKNQHRMLKTPAKPSVEAVLDERKRKAEEGYAQQFGPKKQKSNSGSVNSTPPSQTSVTTRPSSLKRRTPSSSSRTPSSSHQSRDVSSNTSHMLPPDDGSSDADNNERPSRQELEKENLHLRKMLRQSSSMHFDPHRSSLHLPLDEAPNENVPRYSQQDLAQGHKIRITPGRRMGRRGENVPPMPKLSREVLGSWENEWNARGNIGSTGNVDTKGVLPRPVSIILEEEEKERNDDEAANLDEPQQSHVDEQWEWPDDVF